LRRSSAGGYQRRTQSARGSTEQLEVSIMPRGHHDIGGVAGAGKNDQTEHQLSHWGKLSDAVNQTPGGERGKRSAKMRRGRGGRESPGHRDMTYYERWIASIETILIEKKILTKEEIDRKLAEFESKWDEP